MIPVFLNAQGFISSTYRQTGQSAGIMLNWRPIISANRLFVGTDVLAGQLSSNNFINAPDRLVLNSVIGLEHWLGKWKVESNLTHQLIADKARSGDSLIRKTFSKISPYFAISVIPFNKQKMKLRLFYKRVFRMPTFNDLYYNFIGNTNLKPEDAHLINLGWTYANDLTRNERVRSGRNRLELTADGYFNFVKNKIVAVPTKDLFN